MIYGTIMEKEILIHCLGSIMRVFEKSLLSHLLRGLTKDSGGNGKQPL